MSDNWSERGLNFDSEFEIQDLKTKNVPVVIEKKESDTDEKEKR